ncbi:MAG TPA: hypothetical protein VF800_02105 [Telluria sp.]|jgi:hypothetical protein
MNILSTGLATATFSAALLASAPAAAGTFLTMYYGADNSARIGIYWNWDGNTQRTSSFYITDSKCDRLAPRLTFYNSSGSTSRTNTKGCGTTVWYYEQIRLGDLRVTFVGPFTGSAKSTGDDK